MAKPRTPPWRAPRWQRKDAQWAIAVTVIVLLVTTLHYATSPARLHLHVLYRELYFVPIVLAAFRFGRWGGLATALAVTLFYAPHVAMSVRTAESTVGNVLQIVVFHLAGVGVGAYRDLQSGHARALNTAPAGPPRRLGRKILVCVDESAAGQQAVSCAADLFARDLDAVITLLSVPIEPRPDLFADSAMRQDRAKQVAASAQAGLQRATDLLRARGIGAARVRIRIAPVEGARPSEVILAEQRTGGHDAIVVGRHPLTRTQEFLFGDVALRLAREATCPIFIVRSDEAPAGAAAGPDEHSAASQLD